MIERMTDPYRNSKHPEWPEVDEFNLDAHWEWTALRTGDGTLLRYIRVQCNHLETVPVETGGEVVARLCLTCDQQLPS